MAKAKENAESVASPEKPEKNGAAEATAEAKPRVAWAVRAVSDPAPKACGPQVGARTRALRHQTRRICLSAVSVSERSELCDAT